MMTRQTKFILAILLQVVVILAIIVFKSAVLNGGVDVMLRVRPVDPRDMLRGDYIAFQYDISDLDSHYFRGMQINNGETIYVVLRQSGKYWIAQKVQKIKPTENDVFIKGKVESGGAEKQSDGLSPQKYNNFRIHIVYGIEQYFIPEGEGRSFNLTNKDAGAVIAVDKNGDAVLKKIYIDDKPWP